jgi:hypothetical protein
VDTRPRWPLTGKLLTNEKQAHHAAVAVKVPDNQQEHPQRGIDKADIVFVELEGYKDASGYSATRLVPVFHTKMAESVEPVRSIRPVDIPLLSPMNAIIGNTGAAPWVVNYVKHYRKHLEGMLSYMNTRGTGAYGTDPSRVYTYNGQTYYDRATVCHPAVLAKQTKRFRSGPPHLYFPFASSDAEVSARKGKKARTIKIPYKGDDYFMGYSYDKKTKRYKRSMPWGPHVLADGTRVSADNVLVIKAKQHYGKIYKGVGHEEPLHDIIKKSGTFYYFNRARGVRPGPAPDAHGADAHRAAAGRADPNRAAPGLPRSDLYRGSGPECKRRNPSSDQPDTGERPLDQGVRPGRGNSFRTPGPDPDHPGRHHRRHVRVDGDQQQLDAQARS